MLSSPRSMAQTLLGVLTLLKLLTLIPFALRSFVTFPISTLFSLFGVLFILLLVSGSVAVYSLLWDRARGFTAYYGYGFVATFGMATFVTLFPTGLFVSGTAIALVNAVLIVYNLLVCLLIGALQVWALRARASLQADVI